MMQVIRGAETMEKSARSPLIVMIGQIGSKRQKVTIQSRAANKTYEQRVYTRCVWKTITIVAQFQNNMNSPPVRR